MLCQSNIVMIMYYAMARIKHSIVFHIYGVNISFLNKPKKIPSTGLVKIKNYSIYFENKCIKVEINLYL